MVYTGVYVHVCRPRRYVQWITLTLCYVLTYTDIQTSLRYSRGQSLAPATAACSINAYLRSHATVNLTTHTNTSDWSHRTYIILT